MAAIHTSMRIPEVDLAEIDSLAQSHDMPRTKFMIDFILRRLPEHHDEIDRRIEQLERQVERLEAATY
jgi:hypothetical protein